VAALDKAGLTAHVHCAEKAPVRVREAAGAERNEGAIAAVSERVSADLPSHYAATTRDITVTVAPHFLENESKPQVGQFVWAYHVRIQNNGRETVQLLTRHWQITDARGHLHEVKGEGVVGKQPVLHPGDAFEYASGAPLSTPSGIMVGTFQMVSASGEHFDVQVPAFSLDSPHHQPALH
jgi:ApaG protein